MEGAHKYLETHFTKLHGPDHSSFLKDFSKPSGFPCAGKFPELLGQRDLFEEISIRLYSSWILVLYRAQFEKS